MFLYIVEDLHLHDVHAPLAPHHARSQKSLLDPYETVPMASTLSVARYCYPVHEQLWIWSATSATDIYHVLHIWLNFLFQFKNK